MRWVQAPIPSAVYTLRTGDGALSADPTSYKPGVPLEIHLRVSELRMRFIGLLMYATNNSGVVGQNTEVAVGDWKTIPGDEFHVPTAPSCGGRKVTHTNANVKALHTRFLWSAPKGTGTVLFRVLIKQGEQNKGNFYWPAKELRLTEGTAPAPTAQQTVIGAPGQACADVCYKQTPTTPYCNAAAMNAVTSQATLITTLANKAPVRTPYLAQCAYAGAPQITAQGYATFRTTNVAANCPASYVTSSSTTAQPDVCYTSPLPSAQGICICSSNSAVQTPNPYRLNVESVAPDAEPHTVTIDTMQAGDGPVSAAHSARASFGLLASLVAALSVFSGKGSARMVVFALLAVLALSSVAAPAAAHNYIKSVHRAYEAAVSNPCQARIGNQPHVQVRAGQTFEIEWSDGHGDYTVGPFYFAIIHESAYDLLRADNISKMLADYVALAPAGSALTGPMWEKHHIRNEAECDLVNPSPAINKNCQLDKYFKERVLPETDPSFIQRDPVYMTKAHPSQYRNAANVRQTRFLDSFVARDKRVQYRSAKYPWIESVSIFENPFEEHDTYAGQADIARFSIPATKGAGDYIVWFYWSGYTDCVDVRQHNTKHATRNCIALPALPADSVRLCSALSLWFLGQRRSGHHECGEPLW
jgi:hypothetical protein